MSRRQPRFSRRSGNFPLSGVLNPNSIYSLLSITLVLLGAFLLILYASGGLGLFAGRKDVVSRIDGDFSCTFEAQRAIPVLKKAYGGTMKNVLHVGPESCSVVSTFLREGETEAWGVEPYDIEDADISCNSLVQKGIVRVADRKFPLPYEVKSFSQVIVSDALDYLSPKYLNKTLPDLARVSADGIIIFTGWLKWRNILGVIYDHQIPKKFKGKFYRTAIRPTMLYGSECWALKGQQEKKVGVAEMRMLRWMCGTRELIRHKMNISGGMSVSHLLRQRW